MNTIVYEETLTSRPHDTSVQKATSDNEMWMQFNVMPRTPLLSVIGGGGNELPKKMIELNVYNWLMAY